MNLRLRLRRLRLGLATLSGWKRQGWFIPYRYADGLPAPGTLPPYDELAVLFDRAAPEMRALLQRLDTFAAEFAAIGDAAPPAPRWRQEWFPRLDAAIAYAMVRERAPRSILEIGSGHSTRFMARAIADGGLPTRLLSIDPAPRADLAGLPSVQAVRTLLSEAPAQLFAVLQPGDLLFIDSSHVLMPGSDVDHLFNRVLPRLPAGALLHIHDIFLPDDYPASWAWRGYNEQQALGALLQGGGYRLLFSSRYAVTRLADALAASVVARLPLPAGGLESSLWLEKR